jgi:hypothetical protein
METRTKLILGGVALGLFVFSKPGNTPHSSAVGGANKNLDLLNGTARSKVLQVLAEMERQGTPFKVNETLRTAARQAQLFAQGRTTPGAIVTQLDGRPGNESRHQSGNAADLVLDVSRWGRGSPKPTGAFDLGVEGNAVVRPQVLAAWHAMGRFAVSIGMRWLGGPSGGALNQVTGLAFDAPHVEIPG